MVTLVVHYLAQPADADAVAGLLVELAAASRAEPGCLRFEASRSHDDPNRFLLFEQYVDDDALTAHGASDHFGQLVPGSIVPLLVERMRERFEAVA